VSDTLGMVLTGLYAKSQSLAAKKTGVTPGAAWQAALATAGEVGASRVVLIDRPTALTERKLSDKLVQEAGGRMAAALGLVVTGLAAALATDVLSTEYELGAFAGLLATAVALVWPVLGPLREIGQLADMKAEEIEAAVAIKRPLSEEDPTQPLKLFGEDALLDWPGALESIIRDRDTFMGKALAGAATGKADFCPEFVRDDQQGRVVWRYMMPVGAPPGSAPAGLGDGCVQPLERVHTVVGIVGSAHVPGMIREWQQSLQNPGDVSMLLEP